MLGFDGIQVLSLSSFLLDSRTLSHSWSGSSTSETDVKITSLSLRVLSCAAPCLFVLISSVGPRPGEMTEGSVMDARVWYTYHRLVWGHSSERDNCFLSCFNSKILQQIKSICLCIVFCIISGQESLLMCYSLSYQCS